MCARPYGLYVTLLTAPPHDMHMKNSSWPLSLSLTYGLLTGCGGSPLAIVPHSAVGLPAATRGTPIGRPAIRSHVGLWVSVPSTNQLLGLSRSGRQTIATIDTSVNGCYSPTGVKVDGKQNVFVACNADYSCQYASNACEGLIEAYAPGSTSPSATYPDYHSEYCGKHNNCWTYASSNDVALDSRGHVFAANLTVTSCYAGVKAIIECGTAGGGYSWWHVGGSQSAHINVPNYYDEYFYYLDVDAAGNLYIDGAPYFGTGPSQVYEVTNPTRASWAITAIVPPTSDRLGGVYVSNAGTVLNVVDETSRTISQYALPWVASETPFKVLGPTLQQTGRGQPISGGFDRNEKHLALADADGWIDFGVIANNTWTTAGKKNLGSGAFGAAYAPSDK